MKRNVLKRIFASMLAALMLTGTVVTAASTDAAGKPLSYSGTNITEHKGGYDHYKNEKKTHTYDFSVEKVDEYAKDPALQLDDTKNAEIIDGTLRSKQDKRFYFASAVCLGDDYGLNEGDLSFDLKITGGELCLGLRTSKYNSNVNSRGIWFTFNGTDMLEFGEPESELEGNMKLPVSFAEGAKVEVHEGLDTITLSSGGVTIATVKYSKDGYLAFCDSEGKVVAETKESKVYPTGYFHIHLKKLQGYVDNISFTNVEMDRNAPVNEELRVIDYSTWTATDDLDRTIADNTKTGDPKDNRYVGLFYFLCCTGTGVVVSDNTDYYLRFGEDAKKRIEARAGEAYWAEPYFGYYRNTDTWVYRKHGYMLNEAGVDFIYLDVSNGVVFPEGHMALFDTWLQMRKEGNDTPQIVFFNGDTPKFMRTNMNELFTTVYSDENWDKYRELFFEWDGKPLLFGNMEEVSGDLKTKIEEKFTVRGCWAWQNKDNYWSWLQEYDKISESRFKHKNGGWGRDAEGNYESLSITMGHHPSSSRGRSYVFGVQPNNGLGDFEFSSIEQSANGLGFESQFTAVKAMMKQNVKEEDPFVLMITGWNEWISGGVHQDPPVYFANTTSRVMFIDQFNPEFSRDGEPMRNNEGYGFGDNYYYQMTDFIREYKGISKTPVADNQGSVNIYDISSWDNIQMTYMDPLYDTELRNTVCYDLSYRYINGTGRNDFDYTKISQDDNAFYFLAKTTHDIVIDNNDTWMNLYINTDGDTSTGWEGYDYILNRDRDSFVVTVEKFKDNTYETEVVGGAYYYIDGQYMSVKLPKSVVGLSGKTDKLIFKWADNADVKGDPMAFMDNGDTAPDNRYGYVYLCNEYTTTDIAQTHLVYATEYTADDRLLTSLMGGQLVNESELPSEPVEPTDEGLSIVAIVLMITIPVVIIVAAVIVILIVRRKKAK